MSAQLTARYRECRRSAVRYRQAASLVAARASGAVALAGLVLLAAATAPQQEGLAADAIVAALHAGAQDISTRSEGLDDQKLTWASWTEGMPGHWMTQLVLVRQTTDGGHHRHGACRGRDG